MCRCAPRLHGVGRIPLAIMPVAIGRATNAVRIWFNVKPFLLLSAVITDHVLFSTL